VSRSVIDCMQDKNPFTLLSSKEIYKNPWMTVREDLVVRPGGKEGIFGVVDMLPGVSIVCLDADNNIILVREYKYAIGRYSLECVSGGLDEDESVLEAAKREMLEEIGGVSDSWTDLGYIDSFTTVISSKNHIALAQNVSLEKTPHPDEGEVLEIVKMPFKSALEMVSKNEITHGASVAAILRTQLLLNQ